MLTYADLMWTIKISITALQERDVLFPHRKEFR